MKLSKSQQQTADKIITIGRSMGKNDTQIRTALKIAYIESSFDGSQKNPESSAKGVYQYLNAPWAERHEGSRENDEDSIRAFYKDMQRFDNNYADHISARKNDPEAYAKRPQDRQVPAGVIAGIVISPCGTSSNPFFPFFRWQIHKWSPVDVLLPRKP